MQAPKVWRGLLQALEGCANARPKTAAHDEAWGRAWLLTADLLQLGNPSMPRAAWKKLISDMQVGMHLLHGHGYMYKSSPPAGCCASVKCNTAVL